MHASNFIDMYNLRFGLLTVIGFAGKDKNNRALWKCLCDCGNETVVLGKSLRSGNTKSCGCLNVLMATERITKHNTTHGESYTRLFHRWSGMLTRCENPNAVNYKNYGGKGVSVCKEWHDFSSFRDWAKENGWKEDGTLTIDRIDPNGNYEPSNCRWVDAKKQANNRNTTRNLTVNGETHSLADWARQFGKHPTNLQGLSDEEAIAKIQEYARRKL